MAVRLRAVLFDMDDTLLDWRPVQLSWREVEAPYLANVIGWLRRQGHSCEIQLDHLVDAFCERHHAAWVQAGKSLRAPRMPAILLETLGELGVDPRALDEAALLRAFDWRGAPGCRVFPDVPPALELLTGAGLLLGIVTNASQPMSMRDVELAQHGLLERFPHCRIAAVDTGRLKPHPQIFERALDKLGTSAAETVFVGDRWDADIAGALGVGMRAVHRENSGAKLRIEAEWARLHTFVDLPAVLDEWYPDWRNGSA